MYGHSRSKEGSHQSYLGAGEEPHTLLTKECLPETFSRARPRFVRKHGGGGSTKYTGSHWKHQGTLRLTDFVD